MKNEEKKINVSAGKVSLICSRIAIATCLGIIICEFFSNKKVEPIWVILLLFNIAIMNANRCINESKNNPIEKDKNS